MAAIRITRFAGLMPEVQAKQLQRDHAQIAHNALLWDGTLRAMPNWMIAQAHPQPVLSLIPSLSAANGYVPDYYLSKAIPTARPMSAGVVGLRSGYSGPDQVRFRGPSYLNVNAGLPLGIPRPTVTSASQTATSVGMSADHRPIAFAVALVAYRADGARSAPTVLGVSGVPSIDGPMLYPNCVVRWDFTIPGGYTTAYAITRFEVYVTQVPVDMAQKPFNEDNVEWQLFNTEYCGGGLSPPTSTTINWSAGSSRFTLLSEEMFPPFVDGSVVGFGQTESGRVFAVSRAGLTETLVSFSEKYLWHGWPSRHVLRIPEVGGGAVAHYDVVYVPTRSTPYRAVVREGDKGPQIDLVPYPSALPFVGGLCRSSFGAVYVSQEGLVGLAGDEAKILTAQWLNSGNVFYNGFGLKNVVVGEWWNGQYVGFGSSTIGCLIDLPDGMHGAHPLSEIVTFDTPGQPSATLVTQQGIVISVGSTSYTLPLAGYSGDSSAVRATYKWRSKVFVAPGLLSFSAAKVVGEGTGSLTFRLYGDGTLVHTYVVPDNKPFRLPSQNKGIEWEVELEGTRTVHEVHVATSMRELAQDQGGE